MRYVDSLGQHDSVGCAGSAVVVGDDEQGSAVVAAEHAREAAAVNLNRFQFATAGRDPGATLSRHAGIPDCSFGVGADAIGRRSAPEIGPHAPVCKFAIAGDSPRGQPIGM